MERVIRERMAIQDPRDGHAQPADQHPPGRGGDEASSSAAASSRSSWTRRTRWPRLTHKRRLSALGPAASRRDRAGFDVRDVHHSHYGRICPIETPEGPNIGLIGYAGDLRADQRVRLHRDAVPQGLSRAASERCRELVGQTLCARRHGHDDRRRAGASGHARWTTRWPRSLSKAGAVRQIRIEPWVSDDDRLPDRRRGREVTSSRRPTRRSTTSGHFVDDRVLGALPRQLRPGAGDRASTIWMSRRGRSVSVAAALIPFLEHDDANRALMGANMQRQAVPLLRPQAPIVGTGIERQAARRLRPGGRGRGGRRGRQRRRRAQIVVVDDEGVEHMHKLRKFVRSNQDTCINQRPSVNQGDRVHAGRVDRR